MPDPGDPTAFGYYGLPQEQQSARAAQMAAALRGQQSLAHAQMLSGDPAFMKTGEAGLKQAEEGQRALEGTSTNVLGETLKAAALKRQSDQDAHNAQVHEQEFNRRLGLDARALNQQGTMNAFTERRVTNEEARTAAMEAKNAAKSEAGVKVPAAQALGITTASEVADNVPKVKAAYEKFLKTGSPDDYKKYQDAGGLLSMAVARGETKTGNPRSDVINKVKERLPGVLSSARDRFLGSGIGANVFDTLVDEAKTRAQDSIEGLGLPEDHPLVKQYHSHFAPQVPATPIAGAAPAPSGLAPTRVIGKTTYVLQPSGKYKPQ